MSTECRSRHTAAGGSTRATSRRRRSKTMRRITGGLALLFALTAIGFAVRALLAGTATGARRPTSTPRRSPRASSSTRPPASPATARTCRVSSTAGRRWSVSARPRPTSRSPAAGCRRRENGAQIQRKEPVFDAARDRRAGRLHPGQRRRPGDPRRRPAQRPAEIAQGGELFRLNCASCHNFTGQGGALSQGKYAPEPRPGHRPADLRARCSAARRTCPSSVTAS